MAYKRMADMTPEEYARFRAQRVGYQEKNRERIREYHRNHYLETRERHLESFRQRYLDNEEKAKEYQREYRKNNTDAIREYKRSWCLANPNTVKASHQRAKERDAEQASTASVKGVLWSAAEDAIAMDARYTTRQIASILGRTHKAVLARRALIRKRSLQM